MTYLDVKATVLACLITLVAVPANATVYDLMTDWSGTLNPNGVWTYRQGNNALVFENTSIIGQAAWVSPNGVPIPIAFQAATANLDWLAGDIVAHTYDPSSGGPYTGDLNYKFTAPTGGIATISGLAWNAGGPIFASRPQDWALLVNGAVVQSGELDGTVARSAPQTFGLANVVLHAGDTVELALSKDPASTFGIYVGSDLTVNLAVPEPASLAVFGLCLAGLAAARGKTAGWWSRAATMFRHAHERSADA